jgi:hypothetical protein
VAREQPRMKGALVERHPGRPAAQHLARLPSAEDWRRAPAKCPIRRFDCVLSRTLAHMSSPRAHSVCAARGIYDAVGAATPRGLGELTALERSTATRIAVYRRERLRKAGKTTLGGVTVLAFLSVMCIGIIEEYPGVYWTCFVLAFSGIGTLVGREWWRAGTEIESYRAGARDIQRQQIERWKTISAMPEAEYAQLLRRAELTDAAGRAANAFVGPLVALGKFAFGAFVSGDLSDGLAVLDFVDGDN